MIGVLLKTMEVDILCKHTNIDRKTMWFHNTSPRAGRYPIK